MPEVSQTSLAELTRRYIHLLLQTYVIFLVPLTYFQRSLIYHPQRCERFFADRANLLHKAVDVIVASDDGLERHGWLTLPGTSRGFNPVDIKHALQSERPVVLYFPGNAGNRSMRTWQFDLMGSLNVHMMLIDYRGYGDNSGNPSETGFARDARSAWNHLTNELGVPPHRIVIYGESLGGGVATRLASDLCKEGIEPGGLILQSTFSSLVAAAQAHFPFVPVWLLLIDRYPSDQRIKHVTCPILQIHGTQDSIVSFAIGQKLFEAAPANSSNGTPKHQIVMPNTDHNDVYSGRKDHQLLIDGLKHFFAEVNRQDEADLKRLPQPPANQSPRTGGNDFAKIDWTFIGSLLFVVAASGLWWLTREKPKR